MLDQQADQQAKFDKARIKLLHEENPRILQHLIVESQWNNTLKFVTNSTVLWKFVWWPYGQNTFLRPTDEQTWQKVYQVTRKHCPYIVFFLLIGVNSNSKLALKVDLWEHPDSKTVLTNYYVRILARNLSRCQWICLSSRVLKYCL